MLKNIYPFTENAEIINIEGSKVYEAMKAANEGDLKPLKNMYVDGYSFGAEYLQHGKYRLMGFIFDFTPYCKSYLVNLKYYGWLEYKTPNKTCLYKIIGRHNVIEIIEK